jgi:hypothetical protein
MSYNPEWIPSFSGKEAERLLIGVQSKDRVENEECHENYLSFKASAIIVRRLQDHFKQPYDPAQPTKNYFLAYWLHRCVSEALAVRGGVVKFYTAVNSLLDLRHKADGFIDYQTPEGLLITVPFDLTLNPAKFEGNTHGILIVPATEQMKEDEEEAHKQAELSSQDFLRSLTRKEKELIEIINKSKPIETYHSPRRFLRRRRVVSEATPKAA